jgi:hypothetical protein
VDFSAPSFAIGGLIDVWSTTLTKSHVENSGGRANRSAQHDSKVSGELAEMCERIVPKVWCCMRWVNLAVKLLYVASSSRIGKTTANSL